MNRRHAPRPTDLDPAPPHQPMPHAEAPRTTLGSARLWVRVALALVFPTLVFAVAVGLFPVLREGGAGISAPASWAGFWDAASAPLPGGTLRWCADALTAWWARPWFGTSAFLAFGGLSIVLGRLARLPLWSATMPFAATLCCVAYCGVAGWNGLGGAFPFAHLLGWTVCLGLIALAQAIGGWAAFAMAVLYPVVGTPALLAALVALTLPRLGPLSRLAFAAAFLLPVAWRHCFAADVPWESLFLANAPFFDLEKTLIWNLTSGLCLVLLVWSAWWAYLPQGVLRLGLGLWVPPLVFAAAVWFAPEILRWNETMHATLNPATRSLP